jgi:anthranilate phosphoribosyltransferase
MSPISLLNRVVQGITLSREEAEKLFAELLDNGTDAQRAAFLTAYATKGVRSEELAGFAAQMRLHCLPVQSPVENHIDTCGTGGGISSFNISTAAALIAAAAGAVVAKHGNRAVTGRCGSADVLESIGVPLCETQEQANSRLAELGFAFLFAPKFHPAAAKFGPIRKELPFRTVFNVLGPLLNPAGAKRQIIGVWEPALLDLVAKTLIKIDSEFAIVAHGEPGMDEISPISTTQVRVIKDGDYSIEEWSPATFGAEPIQLSDVLAGRTPAENGEMLIQAVTDSSSHRCLAVLPSAAVAVRLSGLAENWKDAYELAYETVRSGKSASKLQQLRSAV